MKILLIVSTGRTDVQAVLGAMRRRIEQRDYRTVMGNLASRWSVESGGKWQFVPSPDDLDRAWYAGDGSEVDALCTPKLDAVLAYLAEHGVAAPTQALILQTQSERATDPDRAGEIVAARIAAMLRGCVVTPVTYVEAGEKLSSDDDVQDSVVNRIAVARIDAAIADAAAGADLVVVAATGGPAPVRALVEEIARLHVSRDRLLVLSAPERSRGREYAEPQDEAVPPAESYRVRRHVLNLIERGDFLGAWGALEPLRDSIMPPESWMAVVEWVKCFATAHKVPAECTIDLLHNEEPMAVRAGIRAELALREDDIPRAVHATVQFFEAALWDSLRAKGVVAPDPGSREFIVPHLDRSLVPYPFSRGRKNRDLYLVKDTLPGGVQIAQRYLKNKPRLVELGEAIRDYAGPLRNDVAHGEPTIAVMEAARADMEKAGLWSSTADGPRFLGQPLISNTLVELGESDPAGLADRLLAEVRVLVLARGQ